VGPFPRRWSCRIYRSSSVTSARSPVTVSLSALMPSFRRGAARPFLLLLPSPLPPLPLSPCCTRAHTGPRTQELHWPPLDACPHAWFSIARLLDVVARVLLLRCRVSCDCFRVSSDQFLSSLPLSHACSTDGCASALSQPSPSPAAPPPNPDDPWAYGRSPAHAALIAQHTSAVKWALRALAAVTLRSRAHRRRLLDSDIMSAARVHLHARIPHALAHR